MTPSPPEQWTPKEQVRFLAINAMSWKHSPCISEVGCGYYRKQDMTWVGDDRWNPLTSGDDMLAVIEAMRRKGFKLTILISDGVHSPYDVNILNHEITVVADADTPGRAVCIAAIKALLAMKETK